MVWGLVLLGGGLGAVARYGVGLWVHSLNSGTATSFPWATLAVNVVGSLLIGVVLVVADERGAIGTPLRAFLAVGILGGFTTFSSFSVETLRLWERGAQGLAMANVGASMLVCLVAVWLGTVVARQLAG
jgi:CrcB protein